LTTWQFLHIFFIELLTFIPLETDRDQRPANVIDFVVTTVHCYMMLHVYKAIAASNGIHWKLKIGSCLPGADPLASLKSRRSGLLAEKL